MVWANSVFTSLMRERQMAHPEAVWLLYGDEKYTWQESWNNVERVANGLIDVGVMPGDRVGIMMSNRPEFLWVHIGLSFIGASSVPVNTAQRGQALKHILTDSSVTAVVADGEAIPPLRDVLVDIPSIRVLIGDAPVGDLNISHNIAGITLDSLLAHSPGEPDIDIGSITGAIQPSGNASNASSKAVAGILYTSGTTGPPKGVTPKRADAKGFRRVLSSLQVHPGEVIYTALPLFHGNALGVSMLGSIMLDASLALGKRFSASRLFDECRRYNAVEFNTLGGMVSMLCKQPPRPDDSDNPVRTVLSAGCPVEYWDYFQKRFNVKVVEWFGMVDAPGYLLNDEGRIGSMGKPAGDVLFKVVDDNGVELSPGEVGELVLHHPLGRMSEYHNLPDATDDAYRDGWFHTGDLAETDTDGYFYYRGRKKESMRRRGENISAWEIESVLNRHPAIVECAAHAVPSELGEDEVKVVVVLKKGEHLDPSELLQYCEGKMAYYAIPRYVEYVDEIEKTPTQRIRYEELKKRGITSSTWDREKVSYQVNKDV